MINVHRSLLIISMALFLIFTVAGSPLAGNVGSLTDKVDVQLYGQINRALLYANDGDDSYLFHVDNDTSSTRVGIKAKAKGGESLTIGGKFEVEMQSNASNNVNQNTPNEGGANFKERHLDVYFEFAKSGKVSIGQGDTATNGTSEVDLSGTSLIIYSDVPTMGGGLLFYDKNANALSTIGVKDIISNLDGNSRTDRLRYDTPNFSGFGIAVSTFEEKTQDPATAVVRGNAAFDAALRYKGKFSDAQVQAAAAYTAYPSDHEDGEENLMNGSASVLFKGFSITLAGGNRSYDKAITGGKDSDSFFYGKLGYKADFWSVGSTALAIDYGAFNDFNAKDDEATSMGIGFVQKLKAYSTELYAGIRTYELTRTGSDFETINVFMTGARLKF